MKTKRKDFGRDKMVQTFKSFRHGGSVKVGWANPEQAKKMALHHDKWPVLTATYESSRKEINAITRKGLVSIRKGAKTTKQVYQDTGNLIAKKLRNTILSISEPRNAPSTIEAKGFDMPLVHSGELINSIEVIVDE